MTYQFELRGNIPNHSVKAGPIRVDAVLSMDVEGDIPSNVGSQINQRLEQNLQTIIYESCDNIATPKEYDSVRLRRTIQRLLYPSLNSCGAVLQAVSIS